MIRYSRVWTYDRALREVSAIDPLKNAQRDVKEIGKMSIPFLGGVANGLIKQLAEFSVLELIRLQNAKLRDTSQ